MRDSGREIGRERSRGRRVDRVVSLGRRGERQIGGERRRGKLADRPGSPGRRGKRHILEEHEVLWLRGENWGAFERLVERRRNGYLCW